MLFLFLECINFFFNSRSSSCGAPLSCSVCNINVTSQFQLDAHLVGQKHARKLKAIQDEMNPDNGPPGTEPAVDKPEILKSNQQEINKTSNENQNNISPQNTSKYSGFLSGGIMDKQGLGTLTARMLGMSSDGGSAQGNFSKSNMSALGSISTLQATSATSKTTNTSQVVLNTRSTSNTQSVSKTQSAVTSSYTTKPITSASVGSGQKTIIGPQIDLSQGMLIFY